jgi:hypothetical protein
MSAYLDSCDVDENRIRTIQLRENPHVFTSHSEGFFVATAIIYDDFNADKTWDKADEPIYAMLDSQSLVFYDRKPEYTMMADKYAVKAYVGEKIGPEYIIPTLGVWDRFDDIDFDALPAQFVLKCTHDSGGLVICKDKIKLDKAAAKKKIEKSLKRNYYYHGREWLYKDIQPRIIAEAYMEDAAAGELPDYKFFAFDGQVKALFIATERQKKGEETKFDFFDREFNHLPFINGHPNASVPPAKPAQMEEMIRLAEVLSQGIPHVRVDFYEVNGKIYFGELTFFHWSGMMPFEPEEWDRTFGDWITLPNKN